MEEAEEKWKRRCARINMEDLIVIGTETDKCTEQDIAAFCQLTFPRKLFLCKHKHPAIASPCLLHVSAMSRKSYTNLYDLAHVCYRRLCSI